VKHFIYLASWNEMKEGKARGFDVSSFYFLAPWSEIKKAKAKVRVVPSFYFSLLNEKYEN